MSNKEPKQFAIEDHAFSVRRLKVKDSLKGLKLVGKVLLPAIAEAHSAPAGQIGNAVARVIESLDCLPELLDLFAPYTKFTCDGSAGGRKQENLCDMQNFVNDIFEGNPDWVVQYLVECVQGEYGAFLSGRGPLAGLLAVATRKATPTPAVG